jgi:hypothetical protein
MAVSFAKVHVGATYSRPYWCGVVFLRRVFTEPATAELAALDVAVTES